MCILLLYSAQINTILQNHNHQNLNDTVGHLLHDQREKFFLWIFYRFLLTDFVIVNESKQYRRTNE